jgi:chromosome segregation ATPase
VVEEQTRTDLVALTSKTGQELRLFLQSPVPSAKVKEGLEQAAALHGKLIDTERELAELHAQLKVISEDQARLRANFERLPSNSAAYKRYLEKFDTQETDIEKLQREIKKQQETMKSQQKAYEDYLAGLSVE